MTDEDKMDVDEAPTVVQGEPPHSTHKDSHGETPQQSGDSQKKGDSPKTVAKVSEKKEEGVYTDESSSDTIITESTKDSGKVPLPVVEDISTEEEREKEVRPRQTFVEAHGSVAPTFSHF